MATIKKLDQQVIDKIAAGEIINQISNAVKELIENSIDAKCTSISVSFKGGGLKFLQVCDNGCGINKDDMKFVCERFATSKLENFSDLQHMTTYGFRGEALASISYICSDMQIISKVNNVESEESDDDCFGYQSSFKNGRMVSTFKPCAAKNGTSITMSHMFKNMPNRYKILIKRESTEIKHIFQVVSRYSIQNPHISFSLKNLDKNKVLLSTLHDSSCTSNLLKIYSLKSKDYLKKMNINDTSTIISIYSSIKKVRYHELIIFVNKRLVECPRLQRNVIKCYQESSLKSCGYLVYISIQIDPKNIDVNVHPSKSQVIFLNQDDVFSKICTSINEILCQCNENSVMFEKINNKLISNLSQKSITKYPNCNTLIVYPHSHNRKDFRDVKLQSFYQNVDSSFQAINNESINLDSIMQLQKDYELDIDAGFTEIMNKHSYVGRCNNRFSLIQHGTNLIIVDIFILTSHLFYRTCIYKIGNFNFINLEANFSIYELIKMGLDDPDCGWTQEDGDKEHLAENGTLNIVSKTDLLLDYFSIVVVDNKYIQTLPSLVVNFVPNLQYLPGFLLRLACEVDWSEEKRCLKNIAQEIVLFYCKQFDNDSSNEPLAVKNDPLEHTIFNECRKCVFTKRSIWDDNQMIKSHKILADNEMFYKIFERC